MADDDEGDDKDKDEDEDADRMSISGYSQTAEADTPSGKRVTAQQEAFILRKAAANEENARRGALSRQQAPEVQVSSRMVC